MPPLKKALIFTAVFSFLPQSQASRAQRIADLICQYSNEARREHGLPELPLANPLDRIAEYHAGRMVRYENDLRGYHIDPNPSDERMATVKGRLKVIGFLPGSENVTGFGLNPEAFRNNWNNVARRMVDNWLGSPGHRRNLLDPEHTYMGCGFAIVETNNSWYWVLGVQNFTKKAFD